MTARGRWIVRVAIIAFAVLPAVVFGVTAVGTTAQVASATHHATRRALSLGAAGARLEAVGVVGLHVSQAVRFRDWSTVALPFAPAFGRLGSRRGLRRAKRQIDGGRPSRRRVDDKAEAFLDRTSGAGPSPDAQPS